MIIIIIKLIEKKNTTNNKIIKHLIKIKYTIIKKIMPMYNKFLLYIYIHWYFFFFFFFFFWQKNIKLKLLNHW